MTAEAPPPGPDWPASCSAGGCRGLREGARNKALTVSSLPLPSAPRQPRKPGETIPVPGELFSGRALSMPGRGQHPGWLGSYRAPTELAAAERGRCDCTRAKPGDLDSRHRVVRVMEGALFLMHFCLQSGKG